MNANNEIQQPKESGARCDHTTDSPGGGKDTDSPATHSNSDSGQVEPENSQKRSLAVTRLPRSGLDMATPDSIDARPADSFQTIVTETRRRKRFILLCTCLSVASLLITTAIVLLAYRHFRPRTASRPNPIQSSASVLIPQPVVKAPKSLSDLKVGKFNLQKRQGSDLHLATGDIENSSEYFHRRVRVELSILGAGGVVLETVTEMATELPPHATWHVTAKTSDPAAVGVAFAGIRED